MLNIASTFQNMMLLRKICTYLFEIKKTSLEKRTRFLSQFETPQQKQEFGEFVIYILDRVASASKAKIIGKLTNARMKEELNEEMWLLLCESVDRMFIADIDALLDAKASPDGEVDSNPAHKRLVMSGLMSYRISTKWGQKNEPPEIFTNDLGQTLVHIINKY
jgi:hypothetical protein